MNNLDRGMYLFGTYLAAVENAIAAGGDIHGESEPRYWSFVESYGKASKAQFKEALGEDRGEARWVERNALVVLANEARAILKGMLDGKRSRERAVAELARVKQQLDRVILLWPIAADAVVAKLTAQKFIEQAAAAQGIGQEEYIAKLRVKDLNGWKPLEAVDVVKEIEALMGIPSLPVDTVPADFGAGSDEIIEFLKKHWKIGAAGLAIILLLRK